MSAKEVGPRLGRGLAALLGENTPVAAGAGAGGITAIPIEHLQPGPFQPRDTMDPSDLQDLADSIRARGVLQPLLARPHPTERDRYQIIAGERRWRASQLAGLHEIPVLVRPLSDPEAMAAALVENLQRADLNPMEQARAYQRLSNDFKMTQEQMALRTGKERASVANFLRLLRLPPSVQQKVENGELSFGHARTLLGLQTPEQITAAAQKVMALSMSVRQTETYIHGLMNPESKAAKEQKLEPPQDPNVHEAQDRLQRALGLRVKIEDKKGKGRVIIEYSGLEDFDALLTALNAQPND